MKKIKLMQDLALKGKRVILRTDLNIPVLNGKILDNTRIVKILPTIRYLLEHNAKIMIISHFGRPKGIINNEMSLSLVGDELSKLLEKQVKFIDDCISSEALDSSKKMQEGDIILLENLRFYQEEEQADLDFAKKLSLLADIYINDAFSCSHRNHASITTITKFIPAAAGLLLQDELFNLEQNLSDPKAPLGAIIGGAKISTKINLLYSLIKKADLVVIGGAMANSFIKACGYNIGKSLYEADLIDTAKEIIKQGQQNNCQLILPVDVVTSSLVNDPALSIVKTNEVTDDSMILDIGPKTVSLIEDKLEQIKTLVWNGPLGAFEYKPYDISTINLARKVSDLTHKGKLVSVAGGGDIVSALTNSNMVSNFSYISTAGGAFLEWLEGIDLPGIEVLRN